MFQFCCVLNGCVLDDAVSFFSGNILFRRQIDRCRRENTAVRMRMYAFGEVFVLIQNGIKPLCSLSPKEIAPFQRQLDSYCAVKDSVLNAYEDRMSWANKMVINIAKAGYFSSDRTIAILFRIFWQGSSAIQLPRGIALFYSYCSFLFVVFILSLLFLLYENRRLQTCVPCAILYV